MNKLVLPFVLGAVVASGASAQELTYGGLLASHGKYDAGSVDFNATILSGEFGASFGAFDAWVMGTSVDIDISGVPVDLNADVATIGVGYTFGQAVRADLSSSNLSIGLGGLGVDVGLTEIGAAYDNGTYFGRVSYAEFDNSAALGLEDAIGVHLGYTGDNGFSGSLSGHWLDDTADVFDSPLMILSLGYETNNFSAEVDAGQIDILGTDLSVFALSGEYNFNADLSVYGSFADLSAGPLDMNAVQLGVAYDFTERARVFADASKFTGNLGMDDVTGFNVGVKFDLGDKPASYETTTDRLSGLLESGLGRNF